MLGKNDYHIRIQQEKSYQNDELSFLGFVINNYKQRNEDALGCLTNVICTLLCKYATSYSLEQTLHTLRYMWRRRVHDRALVKIMT